MGTGREGSAQMEKMEVKVQKDEGIEMKKNTYRLTL